MPGADQTRPPPTAGPSDLSPPAAAWRVARATRGAVLVDGAAYFYALRQSMLRARHSLYIVGWDVDGRTPMGDPADPPRDGLPLHLRDFLIALVKRRPELEIHILLWDFTVLYSLSREMMPTLSLGWATPDRIHLGLDDAVPIEACQHQKLVVVDDAVGFCGGMDIALRRWDTSRHLPTDLRRTDPDGEAYEAVHDAAMAVDGEAARALGEHVRDRWLLAVGEVLTPPPAAEVTPGADPWPPHLTPGTPGGETLGPVVGGPFDVALARTCAAHTGREGVFEILPQYLRAIAGARRTIYIENQYLSAKAIADALIDRLARPDPPQVVLITTRSHDGWLEGVTMGAARIAFLQALARRGVRERVRVVHPWVLDDDGETRVGVKVHGKLMIVDDTTLIIGSANIANRSLGLDCEMTLTVEAADAAQRAFIAAVRDRLVAEHVGVAPALVADRRAAGASLLDILDSLGDGRHGRGLAPLPDGDPETLDRLEPLVRLGDPERPIDIEEFLMHEAPPPVSARRRPVLRHLWLGTALIAVALALVLAWRFTPLSEIVDPAALKDHLAGLRDTPWAPAAVVGLYVGLGLIAFPVTVLIAATAMLFGPAWGFGYAMAGTLASAGTAYALGHVLGRDLIRRYAGHTVNKLSQRLGRHGILAVIILRMAPVAPFTVVNLIAGASHVRAFDFMAGTLLGMLPGVTLMTLFGSSLINLLDDPQPHHVLVLGGIVALWIGVSVVLQRVAARVRARREKRAG